jgi:hypothetical protein
MVSRGILWLMAAGGLPLAVFCQNAPRTAPIPSDALELVTGAIRAADTPASRATALQLLDRARGSYALRSAGQGYDLKVTFTVNSGGQTEFDGTWKMHDVFDPQQGLRWTAKAPAAYAITRIFANGMLYGEDGANYIPLRLQEARAALFDPIASASAATRMAIRKSSAIVNGAQLTCVLLSGSGNPVSATPGRRWDETEDCIDRQTGLLQTHSQVPGRYYSYDYTNAPQLAGHGLPRKVTVTEAGKTVTEISVDSLTELNAAEPSLFVPTDEMKARGPAIAMTGAQKVVRFNTAGPFKPGTTAQPVCVFGVVTPTGELAEAHSLQPSDPNSEAAVEDAKQMNFAPLSRGGGHPQQHFVFVIEEFVSSR